MSFTYISPPLIQTMTLMPTPFLHTQHEMMAAFNVTKLLDLGYNETDFRDPMEGRWRAEPVTSAKMTTAAITEKVEFMASLQPYNNVDEVMDELDLYWASHKKRSAPAPVPAPAAAGPEAPVKRRMRIEGSRIKML